MPKAIEVFTPNDLPTFTYVERAGRRFEDRLRVSSDLRPVRVHLDLQVPALGILSLWRLAYCTTEIDCRPKPIFRPTACLCVYD